MSTRELRPVRASSLLAAMGVLLLAAVSAQAQIATGSYVGDGTDPRPIPVSFRPDVVIVKVDFEYLDSVPSVKDVCSNAVIRTSTMAGDASKLMVGAPQPPADPDCPSPSTGLIPNQIQSLDVNGFTVGNDLRVNGALGACGGANCTYYWVAFKANGDLRLGTYAGDGGTQLITGLGFSPEYVMVLPNNNNRAHHRTPAGGTRSDRFGAGGATTLAITSLDTDGFTVTADSAPNNVNAAGVTYHYVAWNAVAGSTAVGSYVGNGVDNRPIELPGFQPRYVIVQSLTDSGGSDAIQRTASMTGDVSVNFRGDIQINRIQALRPLGFEVGTYAGINNAAETYAFMAFGDVADNPCGTGGSWWNPAWGRRRRIVFNNSGQAENLNDFPVLVKLDSSRIDYARTKNAGEDLRFVDADNQTLLAHEIEVWDEAGTSYVWVKVPRINASSSSDFIYMYYDNSGASDGQSAPAVWSNGYGGVWHLKEDPAGAAPQFLDSTANPNDGTALNSPVQAAGQIDGSLSFDGTSDRNVQVTNNASLQFSSNLTVSAWVRTANTDGQYRIALAKWNTSGSAQNYWLGKYNDGTTFRFYVDGAENVSINLSLIADDQWHLVAGVADASAGLLRLYVDGTQRATAVYDGTSQTGTSVLQIGNNPDSTGQNWWGGIDEVRVAGVARTAAWIRAQYLSQADTFVTFHSEVGACQLRSIGTAPNYSGGPGVTLSAFQGSRKVTGSGTTWKTSNRGRGDRITINGNDYTILSVASDTELWLTSVFTQADYINGPSFTIARQFSGGGSAAAALVAWENCVDGPSFTAGTCTYRPPASSSLVTDNRSEVGIAYEDSEFDLTADFTIADSITDAVHTITLTADGVNRHNGVPGAGVVLDAQSLGYSLMIQDNYVTVEWLEHVRCRTASGSIQVGDAGGETGVVVQNMLVHDFDSSGIRLRGDPGKSLTIRNSMVWGGGTIGIEGDETTDTLTIDNCSVDGPGTGIHAMSSALTIRNTIVTNSGTDFTKSAAGSLGGSNNMSRDGTAPGTSAITGVVPDTVFDTPGVNLHLDPALTVGPSSPLNSGADLSSAFLIDIDGQIRPAGAWDRGADERDAATAVALTSFAATGADSAVGLTWQTGSELSNLGFHVYRAMSEAGPFARITSSLIPGLGSSPQGARYSYRDAGLVNGVTYYYKLEDVETTGQTKLHGPVWATPAAGVTTAPPAPAPEPAPAPAQITYGDPTQVGLRVVERSANSVVLELSTGGFYAEPLADATVRLSVPGFETLSEPGLASLPVERAMLEVLVGRKVRIGSVQPYELVSFSSLRPEDAGLPEMSVRGDGTVRASWRRAQRKAWRGAYPESAARVVSVGFQGETKKALLELAPLRWHAGTGRLLLARRLRVEVLFAGREDQETGRGARGRRAPQDKGSVAGVVARLVTQAAGLHAVSFEEVLPARRRGVLASELSLSRLGARVAYHISPDASRFGPGSRLYFVSAGPDANPYGNEAVYELSLGQPGLVMAESSAAPVGTTLHESTAERRFEVNRYYITSVATPWLWEYLRWGERKSLSFSLSRLAASGAPARIEIALQGVSDYPVSPDHHIRASLNGTYLGEVSWDGKLAQGLEAEVPAGVLREGENALELENLPDTPAGYSLVYLDRFTLRYPQALLAEAGRFEGSFAYSGEASLAGLGTGAVLLDTSGPAPVWLTGSASVPRRDTAISPCLPRRCSIPRSGSQLRPRCGR